MWRKTLCTVHTPSCKSFFFNALQCRAGRCTTQLPRWFIGNKGCCQRGLLHNGSIKSWAEQWLNSHMAIATVGGERESPLDCGRTLKDLVLLSHDGFLNQQFLFAELNLKSDPVCPKSVAGYLLWMPTWTMTGGTNTNSLDFVLNLKLTKASARFFLLLSPSTKTNTQEMSD